MKVSLPTLVLLKTVANIAAVYALHTFLPQYVVITGGLSAYILIGILISFLNVLLRPVLSILLLPFKIFASLIFIIIVNSVILWLVQKFTVLMDPALVTFTIDGGLFGWIVVSIVFGLLNGIIRSLLRIRS